MPWTIGDRATTLPDDRRADLLRFVIAGREELVIKPNRSYGGTVRLPLIELDSADTGYVVLGFAPSIYGLAVQGRASRQRVVNVVRQGGIVVVVIGHPPGHLAV